MRTSAVLTFALLSATQQALHPVSITRFPLSRFSPGAGLLRNPFFNTINAKTFQGLGPKRRESCNGDRVYRAREHLAHWARSARPRPRLLGDERAGRELPGEARPKSRGAGAGRDICGSGTGSARALVALYARRRRRSAALAVGSGAAGQEALSGVPTSTPAVVPSSSVEPCAYFAGTCSNPPGELRSSSPIQPLTKKGPTTVSPRGSPANRKSMGALSLRVVPVDSGCTGMCFPSGIYIYIYAVPIYIYIYRYNTCVCMYAYIYIYIYIYMAHHADP